MINRRRGFPKVDSVKISESQNDDLGSEVVAKHINYSFRVNIWQPSPI